MENKINLTEQSDFIRSLPSLDEQRRKAGEVVVDLFKKIPGVKGMLAKRQTRRAAVKAGTRKSLKKKAGLATLGGAAAVARTALRRAMSAGAKAEQPGVDMTEKKEKDLSLSTAPSLAEQSEFIKRLSEISQRYIRRAADADVERHRQATGVGGAPPSAGESERRTRARANAFQPEATADDVKSFRALEKATGKRAVALQHKRQRLRNRRFNRKASEIDRKTDAANVDAGGSRSKNENFSLGEAGETEKKSESSLRDKLQAFLSKRSKKSQSGEKKKKVILGDTGRGSRGVLRKDHTEHEGPSLAEVTAKSLEGKKPGLFAGKEKKQQFKSLKKRLAPRTKFLAGAGTVPAPSPHEKTVQTGSRNYPGVSSRRVHRTSDHTEYEGPSLSETKDWIQGAVKRPGRCTPMPNPDCPVGSPQYNLGKRFKKAGRKEKSEGGTGWEGKV